MLRFIVITNCCVCGLYDFNTSHVTVYLPNCFQLNVVPKFQYIPCYGLSFPNVASIAVTSAFQYIPCYGLSTKSGKFQDLAKIFQYIPCYGLSSINVPKEWCKLSFQYIPCYGLSSIQALSIKSCTVFQYIPCYGLSWTRKRAKNCTQYFNTSHVTVYHEHPLTSVRGHIWFQYIPCYGLSWLRMQDQSNLWHFNTSHVTVYLNPRSAWCHRQAISIHPMLRFIIQIVDLPTRDGIFQYIPCYGLSETGRTMNGGNKQFQYIPCYGLSSPQETFCQYFFVFQYIPCYGLSTSKVFSQASSKYFNTSHVTVYRIRFLPCAHVCFISIHPMLRFILLVISQCVNVVEFQYIPCYGLSLHPAYQNIM